MGLPAELSVDLCEMAVLTGRNLDGISRNASTSHGGHRAAYRQATKRSKHGSSGQFHKRLLLSHT